MVRTRTKKLPRFRPNIPIEVEIAFHEAGHALVIWRTGIQLVSVGFDETGGLTEEDAFEGCGEVLQLTNEDIVARYWRRVVTMPAGPLAQEFALLELVGSRASRDELQDRVGLSPSALTSDETDLYRLAEACTQIAGAVKRHPDFAKGIPEVANAMDRNALMAAATSIAGGIVHRDWNAVAALANALIRRGGSAISGEDAVATMRDAMLSDTTTADETERTT